MPKAIAPTFCEGVTLISGPFYYGFHEGRITYFHGSSPIFTHAREDEASFRMILSQFFVNGLASQASLVKVFAINALALKRWVKQYRAAGPGSFFETRPRQARSPSKKKP
jgi:hypothetical protein